MKVRRIQLEQWQVDALLEMDIRRRTVLMEQTGVQTDKPDPVSERPLSPSLFDAIFPS